MATVHVHKDTFLTDQLGVNAYTVAMDHPCNPSEFMESVGEHLAKEEVFLSCKVPADSIERIGILEQHGFRLVDSNVSFSKQVSSSTESSWAGTMRLAAPEDEKAVRSISGNELLLNRFHLDPLVPKDKAQSIKSDWAGNFFRGKRGEAMVIAEKDGEVAGFLQLLIRHETLVIDLIAVHRDFRRSGAAGGMIEYAESRFDNCKEILVGTQLVNMPSINFYIAQGFRYTGTNHVFHHHGARQ